MKKPTPHQPRSPHDRLADTGPAVEDHGRVVTTSRRAAGFYRQAQRAVDTRRATAALRLAEREQPETDTCSARAERTVGSGIYRGVPRGMVTSEPRSNLRRWSRDLWSLEWSRSPLPSWSIGVRHPRRPLPSPFYIHSGGSLHAALR